MKKRKNEPSNTLAAFFNNISVTAFGSAMVVFAFFLFFRYVLYPAGLDIEIVIRASHLVALVLPVFLLSAAYAVVMAPLVMWLEKKDAYDIYHFYVFRYLLFLPVYIIAAGTFCTNNLCYI